MTVYQPRKRRILVISYFYDPANNPRSYRWTAITEFWARQGYHVEVVCSWSPGQKRYEPRNGVHVYRMGISFLDVIQTRLRDTADPSTIGHRKKRNAVERHFIRWLSSAGRFIRDQVWKNLAWPDSTCLWYFPACRQAINLLKRQPYDSIVSVSPSFTSHAVGLFLKRREPQANWVVDAGDPFSFLEESQPNNFRIYRRLNICYERKIFRYSDAVTVTTHPTLKRYAQIFPDYSNKIHVIPPLISIDTGTKSGRFFPTRNKIRLLYVGTLYKNIREPDFLLRLFGRLLHKSLADRLELHFLGNVNNCGRSFEPYKRLLGKKIFLHGSVDRTHVTEAMRDADVLVNIGNDTLYQLPSKVVEYASIGKPVLNLAKTEKDSSASFFKTYPAALCLTDMGKETDSEHLERLYGFIDKLPKELDSHLIRRWTSSFKIESISAMYADLAMKSSESAYPVVMG